MNKPFDPVTEEEDEDDADEDGEDVEAVDDGIRVRRKVKFMRFAR